MANKDKSLTLPKVIVIVFKIALFVIFISLIFVAAGTINWPEAWFFFGFYFATVIALLIWLKKHDPELLKERMFIKKDVKRWDKIIIRIYSLFLLIMFLIVPLDAVRFHWSRVPPALKSFALLGILLSWIIIFWAFRENSYLSQFVRIQKDRGHKVCTSGPYKFVRHPMYLAVTLTILCLPLFLGSFYALLPASVIISLFVLRTSLEDKTLHKELPGYAEYARRVHYKLIPRVW